VPDHGGERDQPFAARRIGAGQPHGHAAFQQIEQQGARRQALAPGAQHIGGADVARSDRAQIAGAGQASEDQPERIEPSR
jgi:hypothetical protein